MITIDNATLDALIQEAKVSPRKRKNLNFHKEPSDPLQRLLNAIEPGSYVQPHKHESPDKREVFMAVRGRLLVVEFDDEGKITDHTIIDAQQGPFVVEIAAKTWHTIVSLLNGSVVFEVKDGPYEAMSDKNFAPWAPKEGDKQAGDYIQSVLGALKIGSNKV
jgi:cupin fold WbuC family metalloprotein